MSKLLYSPEANQKSQVHSKRMDVLRMLRYCLGALCGLVFLVAPCRVGAQSAPTGTPHSVALTWLAPSPIGGSGTIAGYNIYRTPSGPPTYTKLNTSLVTGLTLTDTSVIAGTTYGYCATTVDSTQHESACTIPVNAVVPSNPASPTSFVATPN